MLRHSVPRNDTYDGSPFHDLGIDIITISCIFLLGGVAQLAEQENHNLCVRGSNPFAAISLMSCLNECHREVQHVTRHATIVANLHRRYMSFVSDVKQEMQMLANLFTRTDQLITVTVSHCTRLTSDTRGVKESYAIHKRAIEQIKGQLKQSRSLLATITDMLHDIQENAHLFLSSAQTLACLAKNTEIKAHHARKEGKGLAIIAQECLALAHQARVPFAAFYQHVQKLEDIAEPITAELVSMITLSTRSEGLLSHAFQSLENLDHAVSSLQRITTRLEKYVTLNSRLKAKVVEELALLDTYVSASVSIIDDVTTSCNQLGVLTQKLKGTAVDVPKATGDRTPSAQEIRNEELPSLLREYIDLLERLTRQAESPLSEDHPSFKSITKIGKRIDEVGGSANDLIGDKNELERGTADVIQLRTNIEHFLTETHTTSRHILECASQLDKEIMTIEALMAQTRAVFAKIKTLSVYAKLEEGRSQQYTGILAPIVHEYTQLEQQTAETYSRLMPQIVNLKLYAQRLRREQKIPSLEIIKQPDYAKIKLFLDDITRIAGEKTRLASDIAQKTEQLQSYRIQFNQAWQEYRKTFPRIDVMKKQLSDMLQRPKNVVPATPH